MARSLYIVDSIIPVLSTDEAKQHLRVSNSNDDAYIDSLILACTKMAESYCNIQIMEGTLTQTADCWEDTFELYQSPVQNSAAISITSINYYNSDNVLTLWPTTEYVLDAIHSPARIGLEVGKDYPTLANRIDAIQIIYTSGYTSATDVNKLLKQAILILVGQWYENRQEAIVGRSVGTIPMTATYILDRYRIRNFGISYNNYIRI